MSFADELDRHFKAHPHLDQQAFADSLGVAQSTVSKWLSGKQQPSIRRSDAIADLMGVEPETVAGWLVKPSTEARLEALELEVGRLAQELDRLATR